MSESKKVIVRGSRFEGLMHIPPMNVPHKLLKELANSFKLGKNTMKTSYGSFKVKPKTTGGDLFPDKVSNKNLSEENQLIFRRFHGKILKQLTDEIMSISVESEQDWLMFKRIFILYIQMAFLLPSTITKVFSVHIAPIFEMEKITEDNWGAHGIVKMAEAKKKLKDMKEKEKKEEKKKNKPSSSSENDSSETDIMTAMCQILNEQNIKRFQKEIYCLPPNIVNMAIGNHPNGEFLQPKSKKPFNVEDYPMFIPFSDRKKLASHSYAEVDHFRVAFASRILFHDINRDRDAAIKGNETMRLSKPFAALLSPYCQVDSYDIESDSD
ncbi:hypothetical protein Ahy_A10g047850 [Arachis hypogaea]|uniref:Uncharacterized protein n=1 Tax=Arachis hypogaea TaxID=3818 RepID=A0A445B3L5_ARAHY|nr:hypothetical protein Ahy_A10g047850 [Arachis hypogaea]